MRLGECNLRFPVALLRALFAISHLVRCLEASWDIFGLLWDFLWTLLGPFFETFSQPFWGVPAKFLHLFKGLGVHLRSAHAIRMRVI